MNPRIDSWEGKRVWVIGASTGIGQACAHLLSDLGARVAFSARSLDKLVATTAGTPRALVAPLDVTDRDSVGVAGGYNEMRADSFDLKAANDMIDLNLRGVFNCLDVVLPQLLRQGTGGIGIVSSVAG